MPAIEQVPKTAAGVLQRCPNVWQDARIARDQRLIVGASRTAGESKLPQVGIPADQSPLVEQLLGAKGIRHRLHEVEDVLVQQRISVIERALEQPLLHTQACYNLNRRP